MITGNAVLVHRKFGLIWASLSVSVIILPSRSVMLTALKIRLHKNSIINKKNPYWSMYSQFQRRDALVACNRDLLLEPP